MSEEYSYDHFRRDRRRQYIDKMREFHAEAATAMAEIVAKQLPHYVWDKRDLQPGLDGVMVVGLKSNPELNGCIGLLEGRAPGGRISVRVHRFKDEPLSVEMPREEKLLSLKPKHVRTTVAIQEAGALDGAPRLLRYDGPEGRTLGKPRLGSALCIPRGFGKFCRKESRASIMTCHQLLRVALRRQPQSAIACYARAWLMCEGLARPGTFRVSPHDIFVLNRNESASLSSYELDPHPGALAARGIILDALAPATLPTWHDGGHMMEPEIAAFVISRLAVDKLAELDEHLSSLATDANFIQMHRQYTGMDHWGAAGSPGSCTARDYNHTAAHNCRYCLHMLMQRGFDYLEFCDGALLRSASMFCRPVMVAFALLHGTDPNRPDITGCSALHHLANSTDPSVVEQCGRCTASDHWHRYDSRTAHLLAARLLQMAGANLEQPDRHGCTPLYAAAVTGNPLTVEALLLLGANAQLDPSQFVDETPVPPLGEYYRHIEQGTSDASSGAVKAAVELVLNASHLRPLQIVRGSRVRLDGLNTATLNGQHGTCLGMDTGSGRFMVQLDSARPPIKVKSENAFPLDSRTRECLASGSSLDLLAHRKVEQLASQLKKKEEHAKRADKRLEEAAFNREVEEHREAERRAAHDARMATELAATAEAERIRRARLDQERARRAAAAADAPPPTPINPSHRESTKKKGRSMPMRPDHVKLPSIEAVKEHEGRLKVMEEERIQQLERRLEMRRKGDAILLGDGHGDGTAMQIQAQLLGEHAPGWHATWLSGQDCTVAPISPRSSEASLQDHACTDPTYTHSQSDVASPGTDFGECAVCLETMTSIQELEALSCAHLFHTACIRQWLCQSTRSNKCPLCNS